MYPIAIHPQLTLHEKDVERVLDHEELPRETLHFRKREEFPWFALDLTSRTLVVVMVTDNDVDVCGFLLAKDSEFLSNYLVRYGVR